MKGIFKVCAVWLLGASVLLANELERGRAFLKEYMPEQDRGSLPEKVLEDNLKWAYQARAEFAWAKAVPEAIFLNDVLPYALLDERRDNWREDFYRRFGGLVKEAKSQREALEIINRAIQKELGVVYSTKRAKANQSPYESIELGMASCTGLSILLADAFRSVGIPARVAGTPAWTTKQGNHNWVEVWLVEDQSWHFTEYYPDTQGIDHSWFLADAQQADLSRPECRIYASSWKRTELHFPMVWNWQSKDVPGVDVSERYIPAGNKVVIPEGTEVRVQAVRGGERVPVDLRFLSAGEEIFAGVTPKPTDDANAFLTFHTKVVGAVSVVWDDAEGKEQKKQLDFQQQDEPRVITLEL